MSFKDFKGSGEVAVTGKDETLGPELGSEILLSLSLNSGK